MAEKADLEETQPVQQGNAETDFMTGPKVPLASSGAQKNQEGGSTGNTPDQVPTLRSITHIENSRMEEKGKQKDPDFVDGDKPATDFECESEIYEYVRGEVNKLGNIIRDIENALGISDFDSP